MPSFLCQYISEWLEQKGTFVDDCKLPQLPRYKKLAGLSTRIAGKIRERAAKDSMGHVHQSSAKSPCLWPHFLWKPSAVPLLFLCFSFSFPRILLFHFFFSIPVPFLFLSLLFLLLRWADEVCEETVSKDIANARHIYIYIVLLVWLQVCPSSHRERSANEVVAWVSRMPSWPRKQNERIREKPLWAQRVRIVFFHALFQGSIGHKLKSARYIPFYISDKSMCSHGIPCNKSQEFPMIHFNKP